MRKEREGKYQPSAHEDHCAHLAVRSQRKDLSKGLGASILYSYIKSLE